MRLPWRSISFRRGEISCLHEVAAINVSKKSSPMVKAQWLFLNSMFVILFELCHPN